MPEEDLRKRCTVDSFDKLGELTGSHHGTRIGGAGDLRKRQQRPRGNVPVSQTKAVYLPLVAKIQSLKENGFGFAETGFETSLFFHRSGAMERDAFDTLRSGDEILAIVGTDPKKPGRRQIVRWASFARITWEDGAPQDQDAWDAMRRHALAARISRIESLLRPVWYSRNWGSIPAPADLEDELLCKLLLEHLGGMDVAGLSGLDLSSLAVSALYSFASCLDQNHPDAVTLLDHIPAERLQHLGRPGRQLLEGASEARRPEVIAWFVRAGGIEQPVVWKFC